MNDLAIGSASSRNAAITPLLRSLSGLPLAEIVMLRDAMIKADDDDNSLQRWRGIIVRSERERRHNAEAERGATSAHRQTT